jgi:uncharacterized protein YkuJ
VCKAVHLLTIYLERCILSIVSTFANKEYKYLERDADFLVEISFFFCLLRKKQKEANLFDNIWMDIYGGCK